MTAQKPDVILHPPGVVQVAAAGGEIAVPEQGHFLQQRVRCLHHAAEPPGPQPVERAGGDVLRFLAAAVESLHVGLRPQQLIHRSLRAIGQGLLKLLPASAERRSAVQVSGQGQVPRPPGVRLVRRPRPAGIGQFGSRRRADWLGSIGVAHMPYSLKFNFIVNVASVSPLSVPRLSLT